ncbi:MAG: hypothetical protein NVSMB5_17420 [Candidatus Velthaea sp.]
MEDEFARAVHAFDELEARDRADAGIDPVCVPQLLHYGQRTERAVVFYHGFTNCPAQFTEIARAAYARGANVYVPRLPKHGFADKQTSALKMLTADELQIAGLESVKIAAGLGSRVDVLGLSVGGTLAAWLAQTCALGTAIAVAPFFSIKAVASMFEPLLEGALELLPDAELWWNPKLKAAQGPAHGYPRFATHALAESMKLGDRTIDLAKQQPPQAQHAIVVTNPRDPAVNNDAARRLLAMWSAHGADAREIVLDEAGERHDIIEPETFPEARTLVYPALLEALFA